MPNEMFVQNLAVEKYLSTFTFNRVPRNRDNSFDGKAIFKALHNKIVTTLTSAMNALTS